MSKDPQRHVLRRLMELSGVAVRTVRPTVLRLPFNGTLSIEEERMRQQCAFNDYRPRVKKEPA